MDRKFLRLKITSLNEDGTIEGHGSIANNEDLGGDVVKSGAYKRTLDAMRASGKRIKMLWQHDAKEPIGVWEEVREDGKGLYVKGRLILEVQRAREAYALLKEGAIEGLSIGYDVVQDKVEKGVRYLLELKLWEVSIVTFPMNELATVETVKRLAERGNKFAAKLATSFEEQNEDALLANARYIAFDVLNSLWWQILYDETLDVVGKQAALDENLHQFSAALIALMGETAQEEIDDANGKAARVKEAKEGGNLSGANLRRLRTIQEHVVALLNHGATDDSAKSHSSKSDGDAGPAEEQGEDAKVAPANDNRDAQIESGLDKLLDEMRAATGRSA